MLDGGTIERPQSAYGGGAINLAPIEPLQKLGKQERPYENSSLVQIVREMHSDVRDRYLEARKEIAEIGRLNANVRSGKLLMKRDPLSGNLALVTPLAGKKKIGWHVYPLAQTNSSQLTAIWTLSRPRIVPEHFGGNNKSQIQHALVQKYIDHYNGVALFDEHFHQDQSLHMMDYGTSAIRIYYDDKLNAMHRLMPIIQNTDKTVYEGFGFCQSCMKDGTPDMFVPQEGAMPQCPECGSYNVSDMVQPQTVSVPQIMGAQEISQGDVGAELLPIPALNWDQRKLIQMSSYTCYRSEVPQRLVKSILGIEVAEDNPDDDTGLRVINALGTRGGSVEGYGRENIEGSASWSSGVSVMDEEWYLPEWYAGRKLEKDEMTVSGEAIPKGVPLEKIFPDAMCIVGFNDMKVVTWIGNEKRRIISAPYHIQSHSGVGKGTSDSIEISEQLNIAHSANLNILKRYGAGGGYAYDRDAMTEAEAKALLKPDSIVGLKIRGTRYTSVDQAIKQLEHRPQNQESLALVGQLSNLLNICFQTTEFTQGVANDKIDIGTLGGQQMLLAQNQQRSQAPLRMKGYMYSRVLEHVLDIGREKMVLPRFFGQNDSFALSKGKYISGKDIPENIRCNFVPDSEVPTNTFTKQQAAINMAEKSQYLGGEGGFLGIAQFSPRIAAWWLSMFPGVEMPLFNQTEILMVCQERTDKLAEFSEEIMQRSAISGFFPPLEEAGKEAVARLKVPMSEENHVLKGEILKEYLDDDEVKTWSPIRLAAHEALIQLHYQYDRDNRFRVPTLDQEGQIKLQADAMMAQQSLMQPQIDAERENTMVDEGLNRVADEAQSAMDFSREQEAKDIDAERDRENKDLDFEREQMVRESDRKQKIKEIKEQNNGRRRN